MKWLRMRSNYLIIEIIWNDYEIILRSICLMMWNDYVWEVIT